MPSLAKANQLAYREAVREWHRLCDAADNADKAYEEGRMDFDKRLEEWDRRDRAEIAMYAAQNKL